MTAAPEPEWFNFGPRLFNITLAKEILATEGPAEERVVETSRLTPLLMMIGVWPDHADGLPDTALDSPLIAILDNTDSGSHVLLVDGYHRVYAADQRDRPTMTVHVLSPEQSRRIEVTR